MPKALRKELTVIAVLFALLIAVSLIPAKNILKLFLYLVPYFLAGFDIFSELIEQIRKKNIFNEAFLMTLATVCAIVIGEYFEAVVVLLLFRLGESFEELAEYKSRRSVKELLDLRPETARIMINGEEKTVPVGKVKAGSVIVVRPGECIPLDAVVLEGTSSLDTSCITGESLPLDVKKGDSVMGGVININGLLKLRVSNEWKNSTVAKILNTLENSANGKTQTERFITRFSRIYTPCVIALAGLVFAVGAIINIANWQTALYRAVIFLTISCPCALVISVPLAFFSGVGRAARNGILIKGSGFIDRLTKCRTVVFDKTGTLTHGTFTVKAVHPEKVSEEQLLELAAAAETHSNHPIAQSIKRAASCTFDPSLITRTEELAGLGVIASMSGKVVAVGNAELMSRLGAVVTDCPHQDSTVVHIALGNTYMGHIAIGDTIKQNADKALYRLKSGGVKSIIMLTGDKMASAARVADTLTAIDDYHPSLLPNDKADIVRDIIDSQPIDETVAFVGDGVNDAPVLALADIGIAMGGIGSDAAIETADVVIMDDSLEKISLAVKISESTMLIAKENIILSIGVKALIMLLAVVGVAGLPLAVFADVGVTALAILNSLRLLYSNK